MARTIYSVMSSFMVALLVTFIAMSSAVSAESGVSLQARQASASESYGAAVSASPASAPTTYGAPVPWADSISTTTTIGGSAAPTDSVTPQSDTSGSARTTAASGQQHSTGGSKTSIGLIVGITVGAVVAIALIILGIVFWRRRKNRQNSLKFGTNIDGVSIIKDVDLNPRISIVNEELAVPRSTSLKNKVNEGSLFRDNSALLNSELTATFPPSTDVSSEQLVRNASKVSTEQVSRTASKMSTEQLSRTSSTMANESASTRGISSFVPPPRMASMFHQPIGERSETDITEVNPLFGAVEDVVEIPPTILSVQNGFEGDFDMSAEMSDLSEISENSST